MKYSRLASELRDSLTPLQSVYLCKILFRNPIVPLQELPLHWLSKSQYNALLVLGSTHTTPEMFDFFREETGSDGMWETYISRWGGFMKRFMKRFVLILMLVVTLALFCASAFGQSKETKPKATLQQQKMCAEQAQKAFEEYRYSTGFWFYTNHFDASTNVCYILVNHVWLSAEVPYKDKDIYDAFEKRMVAHYAEANKEVVSCYVEETDCKSLGSFLFLIDKKFGIR